MRTFVCVLAALALGACSPELLWGAYRPNMYFGLRSAEPDSLLAGLMWFDSSHIGGISKLRHETENSEDIAKLAHVVYDARLGGRQVVVDRGNQIALYTDLVKSADGSAWEVRVRGEQDDEHVQSILFYVAAGANGSLSLSRDSEGALTPGGIPGDIVLNGKDARGKYTLTITEGEGDKPEHEHPFAAIKPAANSYYSGLEVPPTLLWQSRQIFAKVVQQEVVSYVEEYGDASPDVPAWSIFAVNNVAHPRANMHIVQKTFKGDFEFRVRLAPGKASAVDFEERFAELMETQTQKYLHAFELQAPFDSPPFAVFGNELVSSVVGGIGYFYGDSVVQTELGPVRAPPHELFTTTPSRTFFPRGFYWDEGFTALVLGRYDPELCLTVLESWLRTADEDGYIQREQILGDEARSRVPEEFQVQDTQIANPPTLILALAQLPLADFAPRVRALLPALRRHFAYFRATQRGELELYDREFPSREVYRWRGKTKTHLFASGLDDYPRAPDVSDGEIHVDLMAWVAAAARALADVATAVGEDAAEFEQVYDGVLANLEMHWSDEHSTYCDLAVDDFEEDALECHPGYVTLLPFALKLVPPTDTARLIAILRQLRDPQQLWSDFGVRSLSRRDPLFGKGENYWRGAVWVNINYMLLDALRHYANTAEPAAALVANDVYEALRVNVVQNVYAQWHKTHSVWESYDSNTGAARGAKSFSGWTSLVANIMAMPERALATPELTDDETDVSELEMEEIEREEAVGKRDL